MMDHAETYFYLWVMGGEDSMRSFVYNNIKITACIEFENT